MPDLVTHAAVAYFLMRPQRFIRFRAAFYLGTILPDILSRPLYIIKPELYPYTVGIHTPVFLFVFSLFLSLFFASNIRIGFLKWLLAGEFIHLLLDLFQKHLASGYLWLFPFSWKSFEVGLYWPEQPLQLVPIWILAIVLSEVMIWRKKRSGVLKQG